MAYGIYVANTTIFYADDNDEMVIVPQGSLVRAGHPMLTGRDDLFDEMGVDFDTTDAKSTAAPRKSTAKR